MLVLAYTPTTFGHSPSQTGSGSFYDDGGNFYFPTKVGIGQDPGNYKLNVFSNSGYAIWTNSITVDGNALVTGQTRIQGWTYFKEGDIVIQSRDGVAEREAQIFNLAGGKLYIRSDLNADNDKLGSISLQAATTSVSGNLNVGGTVIMDWNITKVVCGPSSTQCVITCPSGKEILSGGCFNAAGGPAVTGSFPGGLDGYTPHAWYCRSAAATTITVYAICARVG